MSDITLAVSEAALKNVFNRVRDHFQFEKEWGWDQRSRFQVRGGIKARLEGGEIGLFKPGLLHSREASVGVKSLDVIWDRLDLQFSINIPEVCLGGQCIAPTPFGCGLRLPKKCFFKGTSDISSPLIKLGNTFRSEVSLNFTPVINRRLPAPSKWEVKIKPLWHDLDLVDAADTVGDLLNKVVSFFVDKLLSFLPEWAKEIIKKAFGNLEKFIRKLLDLGDDAGEWLSKILNTSIGVLDLLIQAIYRIFDKDFKVFELDDPYEILEAKDNLNAVKIPIDNLKVEIDTSDQNHKELVASLTIKNL